MKDFKCPICGSGNLYQRRTETTATRFYPTDTDFDLGKEEVCEVGDSRLECGNDHPLLLADGLECNDFEDYCKWVEQQALINLSGK